MKKPDPRKCFNCGTDCSFRGKDLTMFCSEYTAGPGALKIAYICTGYDPQCSMAPYCFLRGDPVNQESEMICHHTMNPECAANGICADPWNHPERFAVYRECEWSDDPKYYELLPEEEI